MQSLTVISRFYKCKACVKLILILFLRHVCRLVILVSVTSVLYSTYVTSTARGVTMAKGHSKAKKVDRPSTPVTRTATGSKTKSVCIECKNVILDDTKALNCEKCEVA